MEDVGVGPTVSSMRVSVDETGVEDLLSKRSDQLVGGLRNGKTVRFKVPQVKVSAAPSVSTHVFQTQSLFFDLLQIVDLAAVAELGRQNPLRNGNGPRQPRRGRSARPSTNSPYWFAPRRLWEQKQN